MIGGSKLHNLGGRLSIVQF